MIKIKRKRARKLKDSKPEALDFPSPTTATATSVAMAKDDVLLLPAMFSRLLYYNAQPEWPDIATVPMDAVVKVICVHTEPDFSLPAKRKRQYSSSSTNVHSVEHYTQVKLKKRGSDTKYLATVLAIGTECDIAMLTVEDDEFWVGVSPVEFGELPTLQDAVTVVGCSIGGDAISVTSGVVSEILPYVHVSTGSYQKYKESFLRA